ncbi:hypothetical protein AB0G81_06810 [Streptomyces asoensis]|uniref:hypothetical protein n=1 Tax=Streptomyces asoensis TaxID=249586 RepID=UPI003409A5E7
MSAAKGGTQWLNAGLAERWFRGRLVKALGEPFAVDQHQDGLERSGTASVAGSGPSLPGSFPTDPKVPA